MQLIKITNLPIQYQYEVERARLESRQTQPLEVKLNSDPSHIKVRSENIEVRLNMDNMRESMGMFTNTSWAQRNAQRGINKAEEAKAESAQMGSDLENYHEGVTIAQIVRSNALKQPTSYTTFIPSVGPDISWKPAELDIEHSSPSLEIDWQMKRQAMDYVPAKFNLVITQYPKVSIEYLGGVQYVPPSSDPNYEEA